MTEDGQALIAFIEAGHDLVIDDYQVECYLRCCCQSTVIVLKTVEDVYFKVKALKERLEMKKEKE